MLWYFIVWQIGNHFSDLMQTSYETALKILFCLCPVLPIYQCFYSVMTGLASFILSCPTCSSHSGKVSVTFHLHCNGNFFHYLLKMKKKADEGEEGGDANLWVRFFCLKVIWALLSCNRRCLSWVKAAACELVIWMAHSMALLKQHMFLSCCPWHCGLDAPAFFCVSA